MPNPVTWTMPNFAGLSLDAANTSIATGSSSPSTVTMLGGAHVLPPVIRAVLLGDAQPQANHCCEAPIIHVHADQTTDKLRQKIDHRVRAMVFTASPSAP